MRKQIAGITLIALVITIIVLLILAGISIATLTGDNGIITNTSKAKFLTEISNIKEQIQLKDITKDNQTRFGTINGILKINSNYNEKLVIENGKLVYDPNKVTNQEREWLEEIGIVARNNYYLIMMEETKVEFAGQTNIGTMEEFRDLVNANNFNYDIAYIIEDIALNTNEENQWIPIGSSTVLFEAVLDGNNYTISGIYLEVTKNYQGLFGGNQGTIKNLKIEDLYVKGDGNIGAVVGYNKNGIIENCYLSNSQVIGTDNNVGGIVGWNNTGTVKDCTNSATIQNTGNYATGGIVGWNYAESVVNNCMNSGKVTGKKYTAGIVGTNEKESIIEKSYNKGSIESINDTTDISYVGGIAGYTLKESYINQSHNSGKITGNGGLGGICGAALTVNSQKTATIENCYNEGEIIGIGEVRIGGICGTANENAIIRQCYNTGKVTGSSSIGGIVGHLGYTTIGNIEDCYNKGEVTATANYLGGIVGLSYYGNIKNSYNSGSIIGTTNYQGGVTSYNSSEHTCETSNCYYLNTTNSGAINKQDIEGQAETKTAEEMKNLSFVNLLNTDGRGIWLQDTNDKNNGYPVLKWQ